jgi:hypothetical protein
VISSELNEAAGMFAATNAQEATITATLTPTILIRRDFIFSSLSKNQTFRGPEC